MNDLVFHPTYRKTVTVANGEGLGLLLMERLLALAALVIEGYHLAGSFSLMIILPFSTLM